MAKRQNGTSDSRAALARKSGASSAMPLYHQSYLVLRQRLLEGVYPLEQPLPSEEDIRTEFGVSRVTIRRALAELEAEGLIRRRRGSGTYPIEQPATDESRANISGLFQNMVTLGLNTRARPLTFEQVATPRFLQRISDQFGATVLHVERVREADGEPFSYMESFIPEALAQHLDGAQLGNEPLLAMLEAAGAVVVTAEQTLSAVAADAKVAPELEVPIGAPLIRMRRLSRDKQGQPIEYFVSYYRPDRFEYRINLSRERTGEAPSWKPVS